MTLAELPIELKARGLLDLPAAEVGVAEGRTSLDFLNWGFPKLHLVDLWTQVTNMSGDIAFPQEWHDKNLAMATERLKEFKDRTVFLRGRSDVMASRVPNESLGFCYLDASHDFISVVNDLHAWFPKLIKGGVMSGHDYLNKRFGVFQAVQGFVNQLSVNLKKPISLQVLGEGDGASFWFVKP